MKIKILLNNLESGGVETALVNFIDNMSKEAYLEVVLLRETDRENILNCTVSIVDKSEDAMLMEIQKSQLKAKKLGFKSKLKWLYFKLLNRLNLSSKVLAKKIKSKFVADVGICFAPWDIMTQFYKQTFDCKVNICFVHNDASKFKISKNAYKNLAHFDYICCVSKSCAEAFIKTFPDLKDKVDYLYNFQNNEMILKKADEIKLNYPNMFNIVTVARVCDAKGFDLMPSIVEKLKDENYSFCWHVVGDGPQRQKFESFVKDNNLGDYVKVYGEQKNPYPYIKNADLFLLPSHHEAAPMVYAEAMLLGVPVLTTDTCSAEELVGEQGFVCGQSQQEIYDTIKSLLDNKQKVFDKKSQLKTYNYDNKKIVDKLINLIERKK